jgi:hypothetical protein
MTLKQVKPGEGGERGGGGGNLEEEEFIQCSELLTRMPRH